MNRDTSHLLVQIEKGFAKIIVTCEITKKTHHIPVFTLDWFMYVNKPEILIQDCFPYLSIKYRELIKSGQYIDPR